MSVILPKQGDVLDGKYRIDRVLGEGGMGIVFEAFHLRLRQRVAIKVLRPNILAHPELVARFEREARAAATLESPHVAKVLDVDTSEAGVAYMVIEFLEGNDLAEELTRRGRFPVQEAVAYVMEACVPIAEAHALGIIHRDLKPSNLFLAKKGSERVMKLLDFGISKVLAESDSKSTSSFGTLGTPHYMSPEHVRNASDVDRRSDIWSLGVILYELLTGTEPFPGEPTRVIAAIVTEPVPPPRTRREDIPVELEAVIMRALAKDARDRYPDVRAFATALAPFAPEEELFSAMAQAHRLPAPPLSVPPSRSDAPHARDLPTMVARRPRARVFMSAGAAFVFVLGIVCWWGLRARASEEPGGALRAQPPMVTAVEVVQPQSAQIAQMQPTAEPSAQPSASAAAHHMAPAPKSSALSKRPENPLTL